MAILVALAGLAGGARAGRAEQPPFHGDIERLTEQNADYRRVLFTATNVQIVAMSLRAGEDIGEEVHRVDQCFFFVDGKAEAVVEGKAIRMDEDGVLCAPAGTRHNVRNAGREALKIYTVYAPPQHPAGTIHHTKADAERSETRPGRKTKE